MTSETIKVSRLGENIYALIEDGEVVEIRIADFTEKQNAKTGQIYVGRVKEVETRLSAAFVDLGDEIAFLSFQGKRPEYLVVGKAIKVKILRPAQAEKLATAQFVGEVSKKHETLGLLQDVSEWGNWPEPREANQSEAASILEILETLSSHNIALEKGGNIQIETTRALTAIDIDAGGRIAGGTNQRNFNHKLNLEAAKEILRQIRLRNISGLIVIDFVGAPSKLEASEILTALKANSNDTRKCEILPLSKFGLCEIARANLGLPLSEILGTNNQKPIHRIAIDGLNALADELRRAKGDIIILEMSEPAIEHLQVWNFDWQSYLNENIGGQFEVKSAAIKDFEVSRKNALPDLRH